MSAAEDKAAEPCDCPAPSVTGWVRQDPAKFHLAPSVATICKKAAAKRGISLEQWLGEAIFHALVDEHEVQP